MRRINGRTLFVSANSDIATMIVRILLRSGCSAATLAPQETIATLAEKEFDCIILDWVASEDRDLQFYYLLRQLKPQSPIFLFTGTSSTQEVAHSLRHLPEEEVSLLNLDTLVAEVSPDGKDLPGIGAS